MVTPLGFKSSTVTLNEETDSRLEAHQVNGIGMYSPLNYSNDILYFQNS